MGKSVKPVGSVTGVKAQNIEWLGTDITSEDVGKYRITMLLNTTVDVEATLDSGSNWFLLNKGTDLTANALYIFDIPFRPSDSLNFRIPTAGGATVNLCRIDSVQDEG